MPFLLQENGHRRLGRAQGSRVIPRLTLGGMLSEERVTKPVDEPLDEDPVRVEAFPQLGVGVEEEIAESPMKVQQRFLRTLPSYLEFGFGEGGGLRTQEHGFTIVQVLLERLRRAICVEPLDMLDGFSNME